MLLLTAQALHERLTIVLTRRSTLLGLAVTSMALLPSRDAPAHPRLLDTLPADGAIVARCPERVLVRFSSEVDSHYTRLSVVGPSGSSSLAVEGNGAEPIQQLSIPVSDQGRGAYSVRWDITSGDGERIRGRMRFVVRR